MNKKIIRLEPRQLLGFKLLSPGTVENFQDSISKGHKKGIAAIESKIGGGKVGRSKT